MNVAANADDLQRRHACIPLAEAILNAIAYGGIHTFPLTAMCSTVGSRRFRAIAEAEGGRHFAFFYWLHHFLKLGKILCGLDSELFQRRRLPSPFRISHNTNALYLTAATNFLHGLHGLGFVGVCKADCILKP